MKKLHGSNFEQLEISVVIDSYSDEDEDADVQLTAVCEVIEDTLSCKFNITSLNDPTATDGRFEYERTDAAEVVAVYCEHVPAADYDDLLQRVEKLAIYVRLQEDDEETGLFKTLHLAAKLENLVLTSHFVVCKFTPDLSKLFKRETTSLFDAITWYNNPDNDVFPGIPDGWRGDFY